MNRFNCSDSSGTSSYLLEYAEKNVKDKDNLVSSNDFQGMLEGLEDEDMIEEMNCSGGKKRRLTIDQVQALEKIFEVDNKLDTEKKIKLAQELGLQPRQVAIWFQNRRARWKTKQLERDYRLLKANYEALQLNYSKVEQEKEGLVAELRGLKQKFQEEITETNYHSVEKPRTTSLNPQSFCPLKYNDSTETEPSYMNQEAYRNIDLSGKKQMKDLKEGLSDESDSSGIFNEEVISRLASCSAAFEGVENSAGFTLSTSVYHPPLMDSRGVMMKAYQQQQQFAMMEEQNFFTSADDSCNVFPLDQTSHFWYFADQRN